MPRLLIASNNPGKAAECHALLEGCGREIVTPREIGLDVDVEDFRLDFIENRPHSSLGNLTPQEYRDSYTVRIAPVGLSL